MSRARVVLVALAATSLAVTPLVAKTLHVVPSTGTGDTTARVGYSTIQEAVDAAADGDEVLVAPAVWLESVLIEGKSITLRSVAGPATTVVSNAAPIRVVGLEAAETVIDGFELRGQANAFYAYESGARVVDCILTGSATVRGAYLRHGSYRFENVRIVDCPKRGIDAADVDLELFNCWLEGNESTTDGEGAGIRLDGGSADLERCVFVNNAAASGAAVWVRDGHVEGTRLTIHGNASGGGVVVVRGYASVAFTQSIFSDNVGGAVVQKAASTAEASFSCTVWQNAEATRVGGGFSDPVGASGNREIDPFYCDAASGDLAVAYGSPCDAAQSGGCGTIGARSPGCGTPGDVWISGAIRLPDGTPLEGVAVEAVGSETVSVVTGVDGSYALSLTPGAFEVTASHPDYEFFPDPREYGALSATRVGDDFYPYDEPRSWLVDQSGAGDATTIKAALELAWALDTVWVAPGTYPDHDLQLGDMPVYIASLEGPNTVTLDVGNEDEILHVGPGSAPVTIEGLTLEDANRTAIVVESGGDLTVIRCVIAANEGASGHAVDVNGRLVMERTLIERTHQGGGLRLGPGFEGSIARNIIHDNRGPAIVLDADRTGAIHCNALWNNDEDAITGAYPMSWGDNGNFSADPLFCDPMGDLRVDAASPCLPGQDVYGVGCGLIGPYGQGCADAAPFYAFAVSPGQAGYHEEILLDIDGRHFPPGATATLVADGEPDIPVVLQKAESYLLAGTADPTGSRPGPRTVRVSDGLDTYDLVGRFEIPSLAVTDITPDVLSSDGAPTEVTVAGFPFLTSVEVRLVNGAGEELPVTIVNQTFDELVLEVDPGGARSLWDLHLVHPGQDELLIEDALFIEDERRVLNVPGDYATIPIAFDVAIAGDTVRVGPGEYAGGLELAEKHLVLQSLAGAAHTILDGDGGQILRAESTVGVVRVEGFTLRNGSTNYVGGAIEVEGVAEIVGNRFENNFADSRGGAVHVSGRALIEGNTFVENEAHGTGGGAVSIGLEDTVEPSVVRDNVFIRNIAGQGSDLLLEGHAYPGDPRVEVTNCTFVNDGGYGESMVAAGECEITLTHSIFSGEVYLPYQCYIGYETRDGEARRGWQTTSTLDCIVFDVDDPDLLEQWVWHLVDCDAESPSLFTVDPLFCDPDADDYRLQEDSPVAPGATSCGRIGALGTGCVILDVDPEAAPTALALGRLTPNPFNPRLRVPFDVPASGADLRIEVYDVNGRRIRVLIDAPVTPGRHAVVWDGTSDAGERVASGVYFVRLRADGKTFLERATLLK